MPYVRSSKKRPPPRQCTCSGARRRRTNSKALFDAMPIAELADIWRALQQCRLSRPNRRHVDGVSLFRLAAASAAERALDVIPRRPAARNRCPGAAATRRQVHAGAGLCPWRKADRRAGMRSEHNARLRWLLDCVYYWTDDEAQKMRLEAIADHKRLAPGCRGA